MRHVALIAVGLASLSAVVACSDSPERSATTSTATPVPASATPSLGSTAADSTAGMPSTTVSSSDAEPAASSATSVPSLAIARPAVDQSVCALTATAEVVEHNADLTLFSLYSSSPFSIQVLAHPTLGAAGPYALVLRYADRPTDIGAQPTVGINDWQVAVQLTPSGTGHALWLTDDDGMGYIRVNQLDRQSVIDLIDGLSSPPTSEGIGFEFIPTPASSNGLALLDERMSIAVSGRMAGSTCQSDQGDEYRITSLSGDPAYVFAHAADRADPIDVGMVDGTTVIVEGPVTLPIFTAADVTDTDPATWASLLTT